MHTIHIQCEVACNSGSIACNGCINECNMHVCTLYIYNVKLHAIVDPLHVMDVLMSVTCMYAHYTYTMWSCMQ